MSKMFFFRQPLVQFFFFGLGIFILFEFLNSADESDSRVIKVDRDSLLTHMQYRSKSFEPEKFEEFLEKLSSKQYQSLVEEYVREEVLFREALALALDEKDYIIRRRLVQKVEYLSRSSEPLVPANIEEFYDLNKERYVVPEKITFSHVFFGKDKRGSWEGARLAAKNALKGFPFKNLRDGSESKLGDRFVFNRNYADKSKGVIASHFGGGFSETVFQEEADTWLAPIKSSYGYHLVFIERISKSRFQALEEIYEEVAWDAKQEAITRLTESSISEIRKKYKVVIDL